MSDPTRLPAWWPGVHARRGGEPRGLDEGARVAARARACAPTTASSRPTSRERLLWRQEVEESPFERLLCPRRRTEIALEPRGERRHARAADARPAPARLGALQPVPAARGRAGARPTGALDGAGGAARGPGLMRWWGWGEDGHAVAAAAAAETLLREELGADPEARRPHVAARAGVAAGRRAARSRPRAPGGGGGRRARARRRARTAIGHAVGRSYPDLVRIRSGDASSAPDAVVLPGVRRAGGGGARRLRRAQGGGGAVRRRHERGGRRRAGAGRHGRAPSRSTCAGWPATVEVDRTSLTARLDAGLFGPEAERRLGERGRDARALPAVVRVLHRGRLGGHPLGRPGIHRLRAHRRAGGGRALRDPGRRARNARRARHRPPGRACASCWWAPRACSA